MAIQFRCPKGHLLSIDEQYAGKRLRCPRCLQIADIPTLSSNGGPEPARKKSSANLAAEKITATVIAEDTATAASTPARTSPSAVTSPSPPPILAPPEISTIAPPPLPPVVAPPVTPPPLSGLAREPSEVYSEFAGHRDNDSIPLDFNPTAPGLRDSLPVVGYQASPQRVKRVYQLAGGVGLLALVHLAPAVPYLAITSAPDWARAVILVALLELAFAVWMALTPDWSTVWTTMLVLAMVATLYGAALAIVILTPLGKSALLEMDDIREPARAWCTMIVLLTCAMTYACGRYSFKWHKQYQLAK